MLTGQLRFRNEITSKDSRTMKLTEIAIKESRLTLTLVVFVVLGGLIALFNLPRSEDPKIPFRFALVTTIYPGASAERMENLVSSKIEEAVKEVPEVDFVNSLSRNNASGVLIKLKDDYRDLRPIWDRLRRKIERVGNDFPEGVKGPFFNDEYGEVFGIIVTISSRNLPYQEIKNATDALHQRLLGLSQVSKVIELGKREERITITYDDAEMAEAGLSPYHYKANMEAQNVIAPGGGIPQGRERIATEPASDLKSRQAIENLYVAFPEDEDAFGLDELVDVSSGFKDPPDSLLRSSGVPAIGIGISLREGGNIEKLGRQVLEAVDEFSQSTTEGLQFDYVAFEPERVKERVNRFFINLLQSLLIVGIILMVSLGLRTGSVVASMMPLVVLAALCVMLALGLNINLVALAAFIVVLGIMVDTHIVISERIMVLREQGMSALTAATTTTSELYPPLLTATFTTVAGFLPIYVAKSTGGEYVTPLFTIVTITLFCSTLFAFTITPVLSIKFFKIKPDGHKPLRERPIYRLYHKILLSLLPRPILVLTTLAVVFALSIYCFRFIPTIFFPPSDRPIFTVDVEFPSGTVIEHTERTAAKIDQFVQENLLVDQNDGKGITNWVSFIGRNAPRYILNHRTREYNPEYAYFIFNITSTDDFPWLREKLEAFCAENIKDGQYRIRRIEAGPAVGFPIRVHISGENLEGMFGIAEEIKAEMEKLPGVFNVNDNWGSPIKKYRVVIDEEAAGLAGVTHGEIAVALQTYLTGIPVTEIQQGKESIPVIIQSSVEGSDELEKINALNVYSSIYKRSVPLRDVAGMIEVHESANIIRRDFRRTVSVRADVEPGLNPKKVDRALEKFMSQKRSQWGEEFFVRLGGEGTESAKANLSILYNVHWAFFIILLLLVKQTRSFRRTFIILSAVPMGIIGVVFGLLVTRQPFGFTTLIGIVSLTGIVVNNAIILIDRIRINTGKGELCAQECIVEAALNRMRPILLTTITTVGGILPLYLRANPTWQGMAVAIIFGLLFATILVLGIVPILYALLFRVSFKDYNKTNGWD